MKYFASTSTPTMIVFAVSAFLSPLLAVAQFQYQQPLGANLGRIDVNGGFLTPFEDLSTLSTHEHTTLVHPSFPGHSIRIKKNSAEFCDDTVRSYTGYLTSQARHFFFYFFESRNNPKTDDVILWTNGGPGCSSSIGLFMELGPCRVKTENSTVPNPHAWNTNANIFFIDQPIGVGFSYADYGETVSTTEEAAQDIVAFVRIFFDTFTKFKGRPFHLSGESYGGRYLPVFAAAIYDQNKVAEAAGLDKINLQSVVIGNGMTDFATMIPSYYDFQCTPASVKPFIDIATCVRMKKAVPRCAQALQNSCVTQFDEMACRAAGVFCLQELQVPMLATGRNVYDVSKPCLGDSDSLCYPLITTITTYLNQNTTRSILGVDPSVPHFSSCSNPVSQAFNAALDMFSHQTQFYIAELLERGIRVLIYVGTYDWICNWVGNERMTLAMEWSGQEAFAKQALREWKVDGERAGLTRSTGGLTFATVEGAGHMVPYDKPVQSLKLLQRWLAKENL